MMSVCIEGIREPTWVTEDTWSDGMSGVVTLALGDRKERVHWNVFDADGITSQEKARALAREKLIG